MIWLRSKNTTPIILRHNPWRFEVKQESYSNPAACELRGPTHYADHRAYDTVKFEFGPTKTITNLRECGSSDALRL